ncbi:MAG: T9SS type A sorting domain-containing protein [Saprospirales bacterium]|nr:T9SS type A sorting domain-containing protein [Saprospirales bacterium]
MKKIVLLLSFLITGLTAAWAQIPDGSTAPNFTVVDINGNAHSLYTLLDQGKTVYMDVFATWCGPCWNYHQTHALGDLWDQYGPPGTGEAYVLGIEGDAATTVPCITNSAGCSGGTLGNWAAGTPYPLADYSPIMSLYQVGYYPTIFMVCPADKKVYEVGQQGTSGLWAARSSICPPLAVVTAVNTVNAVRCFNSSTGSIDISASGGIGPYTYAWSNGAATQDLNNIPAGTYECTVTNSQGWTGTTGPIQVEGPPSALDLTLIETTPVGCNGYLGSITVEASGGWSNNYDYHWNNGQNGTTASLLISGTYTCTVTDDNGCTKTLVTPLAPASYPSGSIAPPGTLTCTATSMQLSVTATGGYSGTYNYQWYAANGGNITAGSTTPTPTINAAGTYNVQISDAVTTCTGFTNVAVSANTAVPTANAGPAMAVSCATPAVNLSGSGSSGSNFTYLWTPSNGGNITAGANTLTPTVNAAGTYTLVVTDGTNGCTQGSSTTVTGNNTLPTATATGGALTCVTAAVTLAGTTNATTPEYSWTGPNGFTSNVSNPTTNTAGSYQLTVLDVTSGCANTATALVQSNTTPPGATATGGTLTCAVTSVALSATSATSGTTFAWTGPNGFTSAAANPSVTATGDYSLVATDPANGCTSTSIAAVSQNTAPPAASAATPGNLNCTTTQLTLNGSGSSQGANFTYAWSTTNGNIVSGASSTSPVVDAAGNYALLVTDTGNGCTATATTSVVQNAAVTASVNNSVNVSCNGGSNGSAIAAGAGGNASYTYAWSNGTNGSTVSNLAAGAYSVTVTDGENCTGTSVVVITEPTVLSVNVTNTAQTAAGVNDGTATAAPTGGTSGYTYIWSNGGTTPTISGLAPDTYTATVTDANGCTAVQSTTINAYNCAMSASISGAQITCFGANNGSASVALAGANPPVNYTWNNGATTASITNLAPGVYTVDVIDQTNCVATLNITISEPAVLEANASATGETSLGANNGSATANPSGGTSGYTYAWSNNATSQTIVNLAPAAYTVTVTDANGCTDVQTVVVNAFNCALSAQATVTHVQCNGQNNGSVAVSIGGGAEPYVYNWSNGQTTSTISNLSPGAYTASITDANGCETVIGGVVSEPAQLSVASSQNNPACADDPSGSIEVNASGGVSAYNFAWSNGAATNALSGLLAGTYTLTLTDANGCTVIHPYTLVVADNTAPLISAQNTTLPLNASGSATATLQSLGATVTDNCTVSNVSILPNAFDCSQLGAHIVTISATDNAGNTTVSSITVTVVDDLAPVVNCPESITQCWYASTVSYNAPVAQDNCLTSGGEWKLLEGLTSGSVFPEGVTRQTYSYTDASGNAGNCSFNVTITTPVTMSVSSITPDVNNQGIGAIDINVGGGNQPYSFTWSTENGQVIGTTEDISGLTAGTYYVQIKDATGCVLGTEGIVVSNTTGTAEPTWLRGVSIRPNPADGVAQVVFARTPATQLEISVIDATGRILLTQIADQQATVRLDCTAFAQGVYTVRFRSGAEAGARKLLIAH